MMKENQLLRIIEYLNLSVLACIIFMIGSVIILSLPPEAGQDDQDVKKASAPLVTRQNDRTALWQPPDSTKIPNTAEGDLIRYGRELVAHTALYLGPRGKVMAISNGMNCQNCHLKAGKKLYGNNYAGVAATYPKFRARSGTIETIEKRVNDCIERSLNGKKLPENSTEMQAFVAYIKWVGSEVKKGVYPGSAGIPDLPLLNRAADPIRGKKIYRIHCTRCHGTNGEGLREGNSLEWKYPPLNNEDSYNNGAGLFRLSRFAGYVKANMPYGTTYENPTLTDEEAWDVAAYINSLPRPRKNFPTDWPDISTKPFDHPDGPYSDSFSEQQHKYGPFAPIVESRKKK
jgi:thiosulfate dehydrogenase